MAIYIDGECRSNRAAAAPLLQRLGEEGVQLGRLGLENVVDAFAVLEEDKGGHAADAELLAQVLEHVDVNLAKVDVLELWVGRVSMVEENLASTAFGLFFWYSHVPPLGLWRGNEAAAAARGRET